jgi:hypothetical protein
MITLQQNTSCLGACNPKQIINFNIGIDSVSQICVFNNCGDEYDTELLHYAYSVDNVCWSCYMSYKDILTNTVDINTDFYLRIKVPGIIGGVNLNCEKFTDYSVSLAQGFEFSACEPNKNQNLFNPYINMDCAISMYQQLTENVACMFGIPIYYFKLKPEPSSKDVTFKEYTLMNVDSVKQIKMIIMDNQMPSSKPEFGDWAIDFQSDWETEIAKGMFATAFGNTAQPMEGDLIYVPMMKRMWMVDSSYEEKKDAFMWNATTFKLSLVKYQEKGSVDLGDMEELVDSFVKNKYDDLFGEDDNVGAGTENLPVSSAYLPNNLYPVFESDSLRKYVTDVNIEVKQSSYYQRSALISDLEYYNSSTITKHLIVYQKQYCGEDGTLSFIINPHKGYFENKLIELGNVCITIEQNNSNCILRIPSIDKLVLTISNEPHFVFLRWNRMLNTIEFSAARYTHVDNIPEYKLKSFHHYFDIDNIKTVVSKYDIEFIQDTRTDLITYIPYGSITNIKLFDAYNDNISEILQMLPTNNNLIINDTARKLINLNGLSMS